MKMAIGDIKINTAKQNYLFSEREEKIVEGDVISYSIKPQHHETAAPTPQGLMTATMEVCEPILRTAVLVNIIDKKRICVLNNNGSVAVLNRNYFSDIVLIHGKNSDLAMSYCHALFENMCEHSTESDMLYKIELLCNVSKKFKNECNNN